MKELSEADLNNKLVSFREIHYNTKVELMIYQQPYLKILQFFLGEGISKFIQNSEKSWISNSMSKKIFWSVGFISYQLRFNQYLQISIFDWPT